MDLLEGGPQEAARLLRGLEYFSCEGRFRELRAFILQKRRFWKDFTAALQRLMGPTGEMGEGLFVRNCSSKTKANSLKLK